LLFSALPAFASIRPPTWREFHIPPPSGGALDASARLGEHPLLAIFAERRPIRGAGAFRARR
jgi:hypothetical protein